MNLTKTQRRKIYLEAAENMELVGLQFCCHKIADVAGINYLDVKPGNFPELYLFREHIITNAWLSYQLRRVGICGLTNINEAKLTVLLLCAEMCLTENL